MVEDVLKYNEVFVENKGYEKYLTSRYPDKKIAVVSCMDTRLVELLPAALGFKNGDVKMIKNAGGVILQPFDTSVRSLMVAIFELGVNEVMVIGHTDCGAQRMTCESVLTHMKERGISEDSINKVDQCGLDLESWLSGFSDIQSAIMSSVELLREHPLIPEDVVIHGFMIDSSTGKLTYLG